MKLTKLLILTAFLFPTFSQAGFLQDTGINPYGKITINKSEFDGLTSISVSPAYVRDKDSKFSWPAKFRLGLFWSQKSPNLVLLVVELDGVNNITSLESKINDTVVNYPTSDQLPNFDINSQRTVSTKAFGLTIDQLKELVNADKAMIRVNNAMIGYFHIETSSLDPTAKKAILKVLPNIESFQTPSS